MASFISRYKREASVAAAYGVLLMLLAVLTPAFFRSGQFRETWVAMAPALVPAIGMTLIILARHIDISIGAQSSICAVVAGTLAHQGVPLPLVVVGTLAAGAAMGGLNGWLVAGLGLPSIVVTLGTMAVFRHSLAWVQQGAWIKDLPRNFQWFGLSQAAGQVMLMLTAAAVFAAFAWGMRWVVAGRAVYAVGSDADAARLAGVRPKRVVFSLFVLMGALTALGAVLRSIQIPQVGPNSGYGLELQTIAAVVIGGTAVSGGRGTLIGSLIGVALLGTIPAAIVFLGGQPHWDKAVQGTIILLAVASDGLARRDA